MKGYKGMESDMTCRGFQYEIGRTYETREEIELCERGFHFCRSLVQVFGFYPADGKNRFFEVEAVGEVHEDSKKCVTNKLRIVRELDKKEITRSRYGNGNGNGLSHGHGYSYGYSNGNGHGNGYSYGYSNCYGYSNGNGFGNSNGGSFGNGNGHGHGYSYGYSNGNGYSYGYSNGNGHGDGDMENTQRIFL